MRGLLLAAITFTVATIATAALAQPVSRSVIKTGGSAGAYHGDFCPPLEPVLKGAQFPGYKCTACVQGQPCGSVANIDYCLANPGAICFSQLDVYAKTALEKPEVAEKLQVLKQVACEGIWIVTKNPVIKDYGDVLGLSRRLPFKVASGGSAATFQFLRKSDPEGLGRAREANIDTSVGADKVIENVSKNDNDVGLFVQFANPNNAIIRSMMNKERGLRVIPVISRSISRIRVGETPVYQVQKFELAGGWGTTEVETTCTPVVILGSKPTMFKDKADADDQRDLIEQFGKVSEDALLPKTGTLAALMKKMRKVSDSAMQAAYDKIEASQKRSEKN
jgi:hypothetical protein